MGCDIHTMVEIQGADGKWRAFTEPIFTDKYDPKSPFPDRNYGLFAWLADVRNYGAVRPLAGVRRGVPPDCSRDWQIVVEKWGRNLHTHSWVLLKTLLDFDYDRTFEDRRCTRQLGPNFWSGAETADPGEGVITTYRKYFGNEYFADLEVMRSRWENATDRVRIVFAFDN